MTPRRHGDASGQPQHGIRRATKIARILRRTAAAATRARNDRAAGPTCSTPRPRSWAVSCACVTCGARRASVRPEFACSTPRRAKPSRTLAQRRLQPPPRRARAGRHLGMADGRLPAVFNDAAFHRVREDRSTLQAAVDAARFGPQQLMVRRLRDAACSALSAHATVCAVGPARRGPRGCARYAGRGAHESWCMPEARRTTQDFLVLAGGKSSTQLQSVQELADRLAFAQGAPLCWPPRCGARRLTLHRQAGARCASPS